MQVDDDSVLPARPASIVAPHVNLPKAGVFSSVWLHGAKIAFNAPMQGVCHLEKNQAGKDGIRRQAVHCGAHGAHTLMWVKLAELKLALILSRMGPSMMLAVKASACTMVLPTLGIGLACMMPRDMTRMPTSWGVIAFMLHPIYDKEIAIILYRQLLNRHWTPTFQQDRKHTSKLILWPAMYSCFG